MIQARHGRHTVCYRLMNIQTLWLCQCYSKEPGCLIRTEQNSQVLLLRLEEEMGEETRLGHSMKCCWNKIKVLLTMATNTTELQGTRSDFFFLDNVLSTCILNDFRLDHNGSFPAQQDSHHPLISIFVGKSKQKVCPWRYTQSIQV